MNKRDLIANAYALLKENGVRKEVIVPPHSFTVSDDEGNSKIFTVKTSKKKVYFSYEDVANVLEALLAIAQEGIIHGEDIKLYGFGNLELFYRKPRRVKSVVTGEWTMSEGRYAIKFVPGHEIKTCVTLYQMSLGDKVSDPDLASKKVGFAKMLEEDTAEDKAVFDSDEDFEEVEE